MTRTVVLGGKAVLTVLGYLLTAPAWLTHESTHYLFAKAAGLDPAFEWFPGPHVTFDLPEMAPWRYRFIVSLSPTILGLVVGLTVVLSASIVWSWETVVLGAWWLVYTYPSSSDRLAARRGGGS